MYKGGKALSIIRDLKSEALILAVHFVEFVFNPGLFDTDISFL